MSTVTADTRCGRCGRRFGEHPRHRDGTVGRWEVGHVIDGNNLGPLRIEHSVCNRRAGGAVGNARMRARLAAAQPRRAENHHPSHYNLEDPASVGGPPCMQIEGSLCQTCADWRARNSKPRG
jgi:hypothetical protein